MGAERQSVRLAAAQAVRRVTDQGAYSNVLVAKESHVDPKDLALYQRLVFETLRYLTAIDEAIGLASARRVARIQPEVLAVLRVGTAEIRYLGRAPHSAVSEAVTAVKAIGKPKAAGFVNAVLRSVAADRSGPVPADAHGGLPAGLYARLADIFGEDGAAAFVAASNEPAPTGMRQRSDTPPDRRGFSRYGSISGDDRVHIAEGVIDVIDPASAAVVEALDVHEGQTAIDLAAAPGGKTRLIADLVGPSGVVAACDVHMRRLRSAARRANTPDWITWIVADAAEPPFREKSVDRVLLDAPCTGLGTLRRRPEIRHRVDVDAPHRYGELQRRLLARALTLVRPGGTLVYSVCTVFPEETVDVVGGLGASPPDIALGIPWGDGVLLTPHRDGTDGMFIARFDR